MKNKLKRLAKSYLYGAIITLVGLLFTGITGLSKTGIEKPFNIFDNMEIFIENPVPSFLSFFTVSIFLGMLLYFTRRNKNG